MRRTLSWTGALALAATLGLAGCGDGPTAPQQVERPPAALVPFFSSQPAPGFDVLRRDKALDRPEHATKVIGPKGGTIKLKKAGLTFEVPRGALTDKVEITVTAPAGDAVAFTFAPHGLRFAAPAVIRVKVDKAGARKVLEGLLGAGNGDDDDRDGALRLPNLLGVYFLGDVGGGVTPLENLPVYLERDQVRIEIGHFSGYAVASG